MDPIIVYLYVTSYNDIYGSVHWLYFQWHSHAFGFATVEKKGQSSAFQPTDPVNIKGALPLEIFR